MLIYDRHKPIPLWKAFNDNYVYFCRTCFLDDLASNAIPEREEIVVRMKPFFLHGAGMH
jgi:hypothetical protein